MAGGKGALRFFGMSDGMVLELKLDVCDGRAHILTGLGFLRIGDAGALAVIGWMERLTANHVPAVDPPTPTPQPSSEQTLSQRTNITQGQPRASIRLPCQSLKSKQQNKQMSACLWPSAKLAIAQARE